MSIPEKIWTRFSKRRNGEELKLRIQEFPKENLEDMIDFLFKYRVPDEPIHKALKISQRAEAIKQYKQCITMMSKELLDHQIDACYLDDGSEDPQMVGLSIMVLKTKGAPDDLVMIKAMVESEEIKKLLNISTFMANACNIFEKFGVDSYYKGRGIVVHRDYRCLGIAGELLNVRPLICKERGVPMTSAWMISIGTQKAAAKLGWETICELDYKDLEKEAGVEFEEEGTAKLMIIKV